MRELISPHYQQVEVDVPGSAANLGLWFDGAGVALRKPVLKAVLRPTEGTGIEYETISSSTTPSGRVRGYAGAEALAQYMHELGVQQGLELSYEEVSAGGFPTGGTGLSGAESVGAVLAAAILFDQSPSVKAVIRASAKGEPGGHKDNVAPSTLGGVVFIAADLLSGETLFRRVNPSKEFGLAMGFSSHQKVGGTEATRSVLQDLVDPSILTKQVSLASIGTLALARGNINDFLRVVSQDRFHESRRADAGLYGNFGANEFSGLKRELYVRHKVGLAVSGAGPNMQFWYSTREYPKGINDKATDTILTWFDQHGINMKVENVGIANNGAYRLAKSKYPRSPLALGK